MFFKIGVLKKFVNFTGKHLCWSLFLIKFLTNFIKDTPTQMFSCEILEKFQEHLFYRTPLVAASVKRDSNTKFAVKFAKFFRTSFFTEHLR